MSPQLFGRNAAPPLTSLTPFSLFNYLFVVNIYLKQMFYHKIKSI